MHTVKEQKRTK